MTTIRFISDHHTSRRRQTVLTIGDETAARNSPRIVTLEHARNLVAEEPPTPVRSIDYLEKPWQPREPRRGPRPVGR